MRGYVQRSLNLFGLDTSEPLSSLADQYVDVPVQWNIEEWNAQQGRSMLHESPLALIAGSPAERPLRPPFIAFTIGPSGVGKTEMIRQLCRYTASHAEPKDVLPIALSRCSWSGSGISRFPNEKPNIDEFRDYLLSRLRRQDRIDVGQILDNTILDDVHSGDVILALDGLDEVITQRKQHDYFFQCLLEFLDVANRRDSRARIVVTCRLEYVQSLGIHSGDDIRQRQEYFRRIAVNFLRIDFFGRSRVLKYLHRRLAAELLRLMEDDNRSDANTKLVEIMHRPLFLKLLCDLADADPGQITPSLATITDVMNALVENARSNAPGLWTWSNDELARHSLNLFKVRRASLARDEIVRFVMRKDGGTGVPLDPFEAVHKCPFLKRDGERLRFSHPLFFEYFVARGMHRDLVSSDNPDRLVDFDRHVLTVEMRRFLRDLLGEEAWKARTRRSYALDENSHHLWEDPEWVRANYQDLDRVRYALLAYMTEPENVQLEDVRRDVRSFLEFGGKLLHPAYLMYNYEAVAVYLSDHQWEPEDQKLLRDFHKRLRDDIDQVLRRIPQLAPDHPNRDARGRLVLRILDIAYRLKLKQVWKYATRPERFDAIMEPDTRNEIQLIQREIHMIDESPVTRTAGRAR